MKFFIFTARFLCLNLLPEKGWQGIGLKRSAGRLHVCFAITGTLSLSITSLAGSARG